MKQNTTKILIIDDDEINNFIAGKLIAKVEANTLVSTRLNGLDGLNYIKERLDDTSQIPDVIFLDINMPVMNGWEFLDEYVKIMPQINKEVVINMLSSSVYNEDIEKANTYVSVNKFISKPLTVDKIKDLFISLKITQ